MIEVTANKKEYNGNTIFLHEVLIKLPNHTIILSLQQVLKLRPLSGNAFFRWSIGRSSAFKTVEELEEVAMDYARAIQITQAIGNRTDKDYSFKFKKQ